MSETPTCNICCHLANDPFRSHDEQGKIVMGCVDASHTPYLKTDTTDWQWHWRPEAMRIRADLLKGTY